METSPDLHPLLQSAISVQQMGKRRRTFYGILVPLRSAKFLVTNPSLWPWAVTPALINIAVFISFVVVWFFNASRVLGMLWSRPEVASALDWIWLGLWHVLLAVLLVGSLVVAYFLVLLLSGVIASPFNDKLSRETEILLTGGLVDARADSSFLSEILRSIFLSLLILAAYLVCMVGLLSLHLIPVLGSIASTILGFCVSVFFLGLEYTDHPLDRRGYSISKKVGALKNRFALPGGFGAGMALILLIPFVNLLAMPIAVVGGTLVGIALAADHKNTEQDEL